MEQIVLSRGLDPNKFTTPELQFMARILTHDTTDPLGVVTAFLHGLHLAMRHPEYSAGMLDREGVLTGDVRHNFERFVDTFVSKTPVPLSKGVSEESAT